MSSVLGNLLKSPLKNNLSLNLPPLLWAQSPGGPDFPPAPAGPSPQPVSPGGLSSLPMLRPKPAPQLAVGSRHSPGPGRRQPDWGTTQRHGQSGVQGRAPSPRPPATARCSFRVLAEGSLPQPCARLPPQAARLSLPLRTTCHNQLDALKTLQVLSLPTFLSFSIFLLIQLAGRVLGNTLNTWVAKHHPWVSPAVHALLALLPLPPQRCIPAALLPAPALSQPQRSGLLTTPAGGAPGQGNLVVVSSSAQGHCSGLGSRPNLCFFLNPGLYFSLSLSPASTIQSLGISSPVVCPRAHLPSSPCLLL